MKNNQRQLVVIASTMRSGSTLLKALLGQAPDVSQLNEVNFQKFSRSPCLDSMWGLATERILLLKRPGWYHEVGRYPRLPVIAATQGRPTKVIVLVRDVYDTVESLRKMSFGRIQKVMSPLSDRWLAEYYWAGITRSLLQVQDREQENCRVVRYEDLVSQPLSVTQSLFHFMGSEQTVGVDRYQQPARHAWRWGRDDNSPQIHSLTVQPMKRSAPENGRLLRCIEQSVPISEIRRQLAFVD